jgi:formate hydrogenlyase subunit 6/NADH:ubiquinone oxidoreductase subunit I
LDDLPAGFPRTESGVELRILRRLFTPEDAKLAVHLTLILEEARVIARRAKIPVEEATRRLEKMFEKGLIFGLHRKSKPPLYMAEQFVVGFWEGQVNKLDRDLIQDAEEYLSTYFDQSSWWAVPQLRTIPVGKSISTQSEVMPYERAEELVRGQRTFAVGNCICRQEKRLLGEGCDKPEESCLSFGTAARINVRTGRARTISMEEALAILQRAEEVGLVLQPANAKKALFMCTCCGCCCGVLRSLKRYPEPASLVSSSFIASLNVDTCTGCGTCVERCQMEAIHLTDGTAALDLKRCIGCGLCVSTCPSDSLSLVRKPKIKQAYVPEDIVEANIKLAKARGKLGIGKRVGMQVRSKLDRFLSSRQVE